jgi:ABC-2 type transport system permease protein
MSARATFLWSVRRELWEHRAIFIAPLAVAGVVVVGFLFHLNRYANALRALPVLAPGKQLAAVVTPFGLAASAILVTTVVIALFYCLDALYGERRDRSILFWKSMPVSDATTVASKAFVPLAVLPFVGCAIALATIALLLALAGGFATIKGIDLAPAWELLPLFPMTIALIYGVVVHTLWYAPIYGWLLLVSAWARKAPFLWATIPVVAAVAVEKLALDSAHVASLLRYRVTGAMREAFSVDATREPIAQIVQLDPVRFLGSPGLWVGLAVAAALFAGSIWLRRHRDPVQI